MITEKLSKEHLLENQVAALQQEIACLKEQLEWFKRQIFGKRSEKVVSPSDDVLFFPGLEPKNEPDLPERLRNSPYEKIT